MAAREISLLRSVHAQPGLTRAEAARAVGISTGAATEIVGRLVRAGLLTEVPIAPTGERGRPTRALTAHPAGPVVLACAISHERWRLQAVELGGAALTTADGPTAVGDPDRTLGHIATALAGVRRRFGDRVRGLGISAPGTILDGGFLDAVNLGWHGVDLRAVWPAAPLLVAGNDATVAAVAECRRGIGRDASLVLHLHVDAGLGGALVQRGQVVAGATGAGGEFGHMPFGDPAILCPCGARGCWGTAVDGGELARLLGDAPPGEPVTYAYEVLRLAAAPGSPEARAAGIVAAAIGRGAAGLVNALDPDVVTLSGVATAVLDVAPAALDAAYRAGLMAFRRDHAPEIRQSTLGERGSIVGAAEQVWDRVWPELPM